jgi:hypothetical protein
MAEETKPIDQYPQPPAERAAYTPPRLVRHGTVEELTQGTQGTTGSDVSSTIIP